MSVEMSPLTRSALEDTTRKLSGRFRGVFSERSVAQVVQDSHERLGEQPGRLVNFMPLFIERFARERLEAAAQAEGLVPKALTVRRIRYDIHHHVTNLLEELKIPIAAFPCRADQDADWAVTMGCGDVCPYVPATVDDWDIPDPAGRSIDEVREIRDLIDERVRELATTNIDAIRSDGTSHRWRPAKLLPHLISEFGDTRDPDTIRGCADRVLDQYDHVPVRSHILTLAHKQTRECLRHEHCALL